MQYLGFAAADVVVGWCYTLRQALLLLVRRCLMLFVEEVCLLVLCVVVVCYYWRRCWLFVCRVVVDVVRV